MEIYQINRDTIDAMKAVWPCHGLPDDLDCITFAIAGNGDLVDIDYYDADDKPVDCDSADDGVILALIEDRQKAIRVSLA